MLAGAVTLATELLIIFSSEAAVRCFRKQDARSFTRIQMAVVVSVVVMSLFVLQRISYLLCAYAGLLCYRLLTGVTDYGTGTYDGYTVSKPLTSSSTVGDEDIEELHDSKSAYRTQANHVTQGPPRSQFNTPMQQQPYLANDAPKSRHVRRENIHARNIKATPEVPSVAQQAKFMQLQARDRPLTSSSVPSFAPPTAPPGLVNLGNTCFVNAVLQCLTWMPAFIDILGRKESGGRGVEFLRTLQHTMEQCRDVRQNQQRWVNPTPLLQALSGLASHLVKPPNGTTPQGQQDAAEFLLWLLDYLHTICTHQEADSDDQKRRREEFIRTLGDKRVEFSKAKSKDLPSYQNCLVAMSDTDLELHVQKNRSSVYGHFLGQVMEARECQGCKTMSVNFEYFTVFPIPVVTCNSTRPLEECLSLFAEQESLDKTHMLRCSSCSELKFVAAIRIALISQIPRNLILALKRFSYDVDRGSIIKNSAPISVPLTLNLEPYTLCNRLRAADNKPLPYQLQALCIHTGSQTTSYGHYIAYSCITSSSFPVTQNHVSDSTPHMTTHSSRWYCFNDTSVTLVKDMSAELRTKRLLENVYLLFYTAS